MTLILGIETSCDETAAAVVEDGTHVRANVIASQHHLHEKYGGVVPEIASRAHLERIGPVITESLAQASVQLDQIDAVAVGNRPGLIGSLLVGVSAAKTMAWALDRPIIGIDHVRAHLYAATMTNGNPAEATTPGITPGYPSLGLVVSGGHTSLYDLDSPTEMHLLGRTIDDAVGEAYDKAAVILNLPYPGGPNLDKLAQTGNPPTYKLPRSLLAPDSLDFSFSGLKTALLYAVRGKPQGRGAATRFERSADDLTDEQRRDLAAAFQLAAIDALLIKLDRAIDRMTATRRAPHRLLIGGGVSANTLLRRRVVELGQQRALAVCLPSLDLCLDNAAMIAGFAYEYFKLRRFDDLTLHAASTV